MKTPNGLQEIIETFGNIPLLAQDGIISPEEEATFLTTIPLPAPIKLSWSGQTTTKIRCHKLLAEIFKDVFQTIYNKGLWKDLKEYGGCYNFRTKRGNGNLSTHSWGISIDLNPNTNKMGTKGDMPLAIVAIFKAYGFIWGGDWKGKNCDAMHFQYCDKY